MTRRLLGLLALATTGATLCPLTSSADPPADRYENTFQKDFVMDAPWRVGDTATPIPVTIVLKDCDTNDIAELHWIRCWDVTTGRVLLWDHDFGDEELGDDPSEANFWTYVTTVTEGHPTLPDGTPLTPVNLGYAAGDEIDLEVGVYYKDNWFNYTETRCLRVHVAHESWPWPTGWYGGDTHYHTMYTNNIAEFGAPVPAVAATAGAVGLSWLTLTDHSCDIDETGDGSYSYGTPQWEYTLQDESGIETWYRDNSAIGTTWEVLGVEAALFSSPDLRLARGVELNSASVDADSYGKTLHCLIVNDAYIDSPLSGAFGERPVVPSLPDALGLIGPTGFAYAAHPLSDLGSEWGGLDWGVNGAAWGNEDLAAALGYESFRGLQAFNTRPALFSSDQSNPWPDFDAGVAPGTPYPVDLLEGIALWNQHLAASLSPLRKVFLAGGSDAHGDFNYATHLAFDSYATDNAIGKVQTVVMIPGPYGPGNLPPTSEILAALREGRSVVTDGPFVEIGVDGNGDGDLLDDGDLTIGEDAALDASQETAMTVRWTSTPDFGPVVSLELLAIHGSGTSTALALDPSATGEGWSGERTVELLELELSGETCFRAQCRTDRGDDSFRAYTNPIWIDLDATSVAGSDEDGSVVRLSVGTNPFRDGTVVSFALPAAGDVELAVYDPAGRLVRLLHSGATTRGVHERTWNGTDRRGRHVATGVYFIRLRTDSGTASRKVVLLK
jgi:hypothetical protein